MRKKAAATPPFSFASVPLANPWRFGSSVAHMALGCNMAHMQTSAVRPIVFLIALAGCGHSGLPATPLFVGVDGSNYSQGTKLILSRLQARFPNGSSEGKLAAYLERQGLRVEQVERAPHPPTGSASFKYGSVVCGSQVRISWSADKAGKVQSIDALYGDTGCP